VVRNRQFLGLKFYRQYSFGPYVLDFYCPEKKMAVELDGGQHNQPDGKEYDAIRTNYLNAHGVEVERFWNSDVSGNMEAVLACLELKLMAVT
jgi:very-short-patch-repair endonuclease